MAKCTHRWRIESPRDGLTFLSGECVKCHKKRHDFWASDPRDTGFGGNSRKVKPRIRPRGKNPLAKAW